LETPGFSHLITYEVKTWFQKLAFKCNLCRYVMEKCLEAMADGDEDLLESCLLELEEPEVGSCRIHTSHVILQPACLGVSSVQSAVSSVSSLQSARVRGRLER
jgi:hypothetical protein